MMDNINNRNYREKACNSLAGMEVPRWKRIRHDLPEAEGYKKFDNFRVVGADPVMETQVSGVFQKNSETYLENLNRAFFNSGVSSGNARGRIYAGYHMDESNKTLHDLNVIKVLQGEEADIVLEYSGNPKGGFRNSLTRIEAEAGSRVNLINVQLLGEEVESHNSIEVRAGAGALVKQYNLELGGGVVSASSRVYIEGDNGGSENYALYIADGDKKVDLEYSTYHEGRRGESLIQGRGIVKDRARKVFRGNLYFERGSGRSVGKEEETAILMSPEAKADSIPTLFCKEDDVVGEHAASAGQLNENKLFYLMSRGLSEREAKRMVAVSAFRPVVEMLGDDEIKARVLEEIENRI